MVFSFFWVFCNSLLNQVEYIWLKSQLHVCNYEWVKIIFVDGVLTQNFNTNDIVKFREKNQNLHIQIIAITLKITSCKTMSKKKKWTKKILWAKWTSFLAPCLSDIGAPQKIHEKWTLNPFWTKLQHELIWSWNWMCLVFLGSLWNI
jgi:hypothetical protein